MFPSSSLLRIATPAAGGLLLTLAACDGGSAPFAGTQESEADEYKQRIDALGESQRDAVFLRAIREADQPCQAVAGSAYGGVQFGMPSWVARCSDGRDWLIMLGRDGRAHVARREEAPPPAGDDQ